MRLDHFCSLFCLSCLPILWLPSRFLLCGIICGGVCACVALFKKDWLLFFLGLLIGASYFQVQEFAKFSQKTTAYKADYRFHIVQILKQTDYQTAIAELADKRRVYLLWQAKTPLVLEQSYQAELTIRPISGRANIGNVDRQRWYFAHHLDGIATVRKAELAGEKTPSLRAKWLTRVYQQTESLPTQGLLLALTFGERAWLRQSDWLLFQQTATAHLIAISGLHIGLAFGFGFGLTKGVQWLLLRFGVLQAVSFSAYFAKIGGFVFALFYSYLAGFAIPTLRALLAISLVLACQFTRRHYNHWQLWWRIVALLLLFDPLAVLSDSFWLSVLAVLSLIIWYRFFPLHQFAWLEICKKRKKFYRLLASLVHLQLGIWLVFSPVQLFFFEGISAYAFTANLLIVPFYSLLLVPVNLFSLLTDNLFDSWQWADGLAQLSLWALKPMAGQWFSLNIQQQGYLLSLNLALLLSWQGWMRKLPKKVLIAGVGLLAFLPLGSWALPFFQPKAEWITFDVGQGLAQALIYSENGQKKAVFYDTGVSWGGTQAGSSMASIEILPYLARNGIAVEAIFLSHDDNDHAGGVPDLLNVFPAARLISASRLAYLGRAPEPCVAGKRWQFGPFELKAVYPVAQVTRAQNADSCIILIKKDRLQWLWTGDTGVEQERQFAPELGKLNALQVAHHGSKTSTSYSLLAQTHPELAIVSVGRWNPWKMPNKQVMERLNAQGIQVLSTATVGMVKLRFNEEGWVVETARDEWSPWYREIYGK